MARSDPPRHGAADRILIVSVAAALAVALAGHARNCEVEADATATPSSEPTAPLRRPLAASLAHEAEQARARAADEAARARVREAHLSALAAGVVALQPWYRDRPRDAARLARIVDEASTAHGIDPWLLLAVGRRESSLLGGQVGARGEVGHWQVMPAGAARARCSDGCDLTQLRCSAETAACWLAHCREQCGEDVWVWVAAYAMRRCPTPDEARTQIHAQRARAFLTELIGEDEAEVTWP